MLHWSIDCCMIVSGLVGWSGMLRCLRDCQKLLMDGLEGIYSLLKLYVIRGELCLSVHEQGADRRVLGVVLWHLPSLAAL
jgi:hypothetical protein